MAEQIAEGTVPAPEPAVEAQPSVEETVPEVVEGEEATPEAQPEAEVAEATPEAGAEPEVVEAPKTEAAPRMTKEEADALANWQVWKAILDREPALKAQAQAVYQRMATPPQPEVQEQPPEVDDRALRQEFNQLTEQGKHYEAQQLLIRNAPEVRRASDTVAQIKKAEHAKNLDSAKVEIAEHQKTYGSIEPDVRAEMTGMFANGYQGNLISARVAALTKLGKLKEASAILSKAATAPQQHGSASAGGRAPAAKGAPASRRVSKPSATPGSGWDDSQLAYIERRERERGGGL